MVADINYWGDTVARFVWTTVTLVGTSVGVERERRSEAAGRAVAGLFPLVVYIVFEWSPEEHARGTVQTVTSGLPWVHQLLDPWPKRHESESRRVYTIREAVTVRRAGLWSPGPRIPPESSHIDITDSKTDSDKLCLREMIYKKYCRHFSILPPN